jgi:hypothetical protein
MIFLKLYTDCNFLVVGISKSSFYLSDEISLSFREEAEIKFGFFFVQWMNWFTYQMDVDWPSGKIGVMIYFNT